MLNSRTPLMAAVIAALLVMLFAGVQAQGPASSPGLASSPGPASSSNDCMDALLNLTACLTYVEQGSNETVPDQGCCPALASLVDSTPQCLCQLLGSGDAYGVKLDKAKSMKLPTACHVVTPPVSMCSLFGIPVASPASSPMSGAMSPSSEGSIAGSSPSMSPGTNDGSSSFRVSKLLIGLSFVSISIAGF